MRTLKRAVHLTLHPQPSPAQRAAAERRIDDALPAILAEAQAGARSARRPAEQLLVLVLDRQARDEVQPRMHRPLAQPGPRGLVVAVVDLQAQLLAELSLPPAAPGEGFALVAVVDGVAVSRRLLSPLN